MSGQPTIGPAPVRRGKHSRPRAQGAARLPYKVLVDGIPHGSFDSLPDALASARITKGARPHSAVLVTDAGTGRITIPIEDR